MSYDPHSYSDTCCVKCGDPNGAPCTSCGYLMPVTSSPSPYVVTPWPEYAPLSMAEKDVRDAQDYDRIRRETMRSTLYLTRDVA